MSFLPESNSQHFFFCLSGAQVYVSFQFLLLPDKNKSNIENWARTKGNIFDQSTPTGHYHLFSDWMLLSCRFSWALLFLFLISLFFFGLDIHSVPMKSQHIFYFSNVLCFCDFFFLNKNLLSADVRNINMKCSHEILNLFHIMWVCECVFEYNEYHK